MTEIDLTLPGFLDRRSEPKPLIYSFTLLNLYRNICPHQAYRTRIRKDIPFVKTPQMEWGDKVHKALELRVGGGKPLPADMRQWEKFASPFYAVKAKAEMSLGMTVDGQPCDFWAKNVWFRGKVDVTVLKTDTALIADYKTGSVREDPFELETNAMLINAKYPQLTKIDAFYIWLKEDRIGAKHDVSHTRDTFTYIQRIAADLEEDMRNNEFEKKRSGLCGWCSVADCEFNTMAERLARA